MSLLTNLRGYWKMDEASWGGVANEIVDSSGNGEHGVAISGATTAAGGVLDRCGTFDGTNRAHLRGDTLNISGNSTFSIQQWFKCASGQFDSIKSLLGQQEAFNFQGGYPDPGNGRFGINILSDWKIAPLYTAARLDDGAWHQMVGTYDGAKIRLYIDGSEVGTGTAQTGITSTYPSDTDVNVFADAAHGNRPAGLTDEIAVWDRTLSASEVSQLYNSGAGYSILEGSQSLSPSASPSVSPSSSLSPSASESPSASSSVSPSVSESPSESTSTSPSVSISPSLSPSFSPSASPSVSPSVSLSPSVSPSFEPLMVSLEGYWQCNENSWDGTVNEILDTSGNARHGKRVNGGTTTSSGLIGRCATFNGTGNYHGLCAALPTIPGASAFSAQIWVNASSGAFDTFKAFLNQGDVFQIDAGTVAKKPRFLINIGNSWKYAPVSSTSIDDSTWHHLVGTYDGSKIRFYVDGTEVGSGTTQTGALYNANPDKQITIANDVNRTSWSPNCLLDEIAIWSRALTTEEVTTLYNTGLGYDMTGASAGSRSPSVSPSSSVSPSVSISPSTAPSNLTVNLRAYWKLDEASWNGTVGEVIDSSGNAVHGTAFGGCSTAAGGKLGRYGRFTGGSNMGTAAADIYQLAGHSSVSCQIWLRNPGGAVNFAIMKTFVYGDQHIVFECGTQGLPYVRWWVCLQGTDWAGNLSGTTNVSDGNWHHIVGTYDGNYVREYIDGVEQGDGTVAYDPTYFLPVDTAGKVIQAAVNPGTYIGCGTIPMWNATADIDEVAIWDRALSADEVLQLYNSGSGIDIITAASESASPSVSPSASPSGVAEPYEYTREAKVTLPTDDTNLTTVYTAQELSDVATDDGLRVSQTADTGYAIHQFKNLISATSGDFTWNGQSNLAPTTSTIYLQIFNQNTLTWFTIASDNTSAADVDLTLYANVADLTNYKDINNYVSCRVYQEVK